MSLKSLLTPVQVEALQLLCRSISSDRTLRRWFLSLEHLPSNLRANAIMQITSEMRRNEEDPSLLAAVCCLSDSDVYAAALKALEELN